MSEVKVNKISPRTNCGTTTLGDSGDSFVIPSGVTITNNGTQTGFGRTGTVDWQTSIKTSNFTAASGEGYFCNTTSGSFTVTLPASPSVGDIVAVKDYAQTFDTNKLTIGRNSQPIEGGDFDLDLSTEGSAVTLVYGDATKGWQSVNSNEVTNASVFITATGGTISTVDTNYKVHTFTGPGTFTVTAGKGPLAVVDYLVLAGGGGGGPDHGGGAGAGGYRESHCATTSGPYTASPLASSTSLPVSVQAYPITVGGGGTGGSATADCAARGGSSVFSSITSTGGGGIKFIPGTPLSQGSMTGGSGAGAAGQGNNPGTGAAGNTPPVSPPQGNSGGNSTASPNNGGGGGGGAGAVGTTATGKPAGAGGAGTTTSINGTPTVRASGGSGGASSPASVTPATPGGGGAGGAGPTQAAAGTANTGGGGGGGSGNTPPFGGGNGGSGLVMIRYKFQ